MLMMKDIQYKVDTYIVENGFFKADNTSKKELIEAGMKKYIIDKIWETSEGRKMLYGKQEETSLHELTEILAEIIPEEMHDETLAYLTHYVLGIAGFMQGCYITWMEEEDPSLISSPIAENNQEGIWDKLVTHRNTPYVKTFGLALENLSQVIEKKDKKDKEFIKSMQQAS